MPHRDLEKRRDCRRRWYANNKASEKAHVKKRKNEIRAWFRKHKSSLRCCLCGEDHPATIDFHHKTGKKEEGISKMVADGFSIERIKSELDKCEALCSNCHRKKHFKNNKL